MTLTEAEKLVKQNHLINYFRVVFFHREIFKTSKLVNIFQLMDLVGSEKKRDNFENSNLPDHWLSHIPLKKLEGGHKRVKIDDKMKARYPWYELAESIKKEGYKSPAIVEWNEGRRHTVLEGKHRVPASTLIEPLYLDRLVPCLIVKRDNFYTLKMKGKKHVNPFSPEGFTTYANR